jgi:hypothetical protein
LQLKNTLQTREFDQLKKKTSFEVIQKVWEKDKTIIFNSDENLIFPQTYMERESRQKHKVLPLALHTRWIWTKARDWRRRMARNANDLRI